MRAWRKLLMAMAVLVVAATAIIGFAHTRPGRPLLAYMPWGKAAEGLCPLGYDAPATAAARLAARQQFAAAHRGDARAPSRPALGFTLDQTSRAEVLAWAVAKGVSCTQPKRGHDIECENVPAEALPLSGPKFAMVPLRSLWLDFGGRDELVSIIALRRHGRLDDIVEAFGMFRSTLDENAGQATEVQAADAKAELQAGLLRQSMAEYKFTNYHARARVTHMPDDFVLTEEYRSLPEDGLAMARD